MPESILSHVGIYAFGWGKTPPTAESVTAVVRHAEKAGIDSVHMPWHFTLNPGGFNWGNRHVLDPLILLPWLAGRTERIRFTLAPSTTSLMHPFFWAKYWASLSVASRGRVIAGLRSGVWSKDDYAVGMAPASEEDRRFDEGLDLMTKLWRGETLTRADSTLWDVEGLSLEPLPAHRIPVWISDADERSIERAARWGDFVRPIFFTPHEIRTLRRTVDEVAGRYGRTVSVADSTLCVILDPEDKPEWVRDQIQPLIQKRLRGRAAENSIIYGPPERCAEQIAAFLEAGVGYLLLDTQFHGWETERHSMEQIDRLRERVAPLIGPGLLAAAGAR